jgi:uncharacterized protein YhaN
MPREPYVRHDVLPSLSSLLGITDDQAIVIFLLCILGPLPIIILVVILKDQISNWRAARKLHQFAAERTGATQGSEADITSDPKPVEKESGNDASLNLQIASLMERVRISELEADRLRLRGREALRQRDWADARAIAAEAKIAEATAGKDPRFDELRRLLAREFHPDHAKADGIEKVVRAEIFKTLWPQIERIGK